jgi:hypothetical protein
LGLVGIWQIGCFLGNLELLVWDVQGIQVLDYDFGLIFDEIVNGIDDQLNR